MFCFKIRKSNIKKFKKGSEIKARPKRASSLIKSTDVDELLKKIMEDRSNLTDGNLSSSSLPLSSSSPNKLETTSFNQPNEVKYQLTTKSNSSLPLLGGSSQREETKLTSAINEVKLSSSTSNLTDSSTEIPSSLNSSSNENKPTSSRPTINEIKQSLFPEYKLTPSVFSNENKFSNLKSSSTNEIRQNENKSTLTRSSNEIRSSYTPLSASSNEIKPKSTESQIKQNYPSLTSSVEIKPQTIPETSTLKSLSFNDMSTIYKGAPSVLSQSLNDINVLGDGYAVKQYIKNDASFQGLYVSPDPIHAPIIGWLKQNGLDADCFRKTMETLGAKNLDDLKDVLEILEDPNYRNQYGLRIELTPVEFRKLTKAIKTTLENEELKIFPILQNIVLEDKIGEGHFGLFFN